MPAMPSVFLVKEKDDGSIDLYRLSDKRFICTINEAPQHKRDQPLNSAKRLSSVNRAKRLDSISCTKSSSSVTNVHKRPSLSLPKKVTAKNNIHNQLQPGTSIIIKKSSCDIPILSLFVEESSEDYHDDCISDAEFARCLNLVPSGNLKTKPIEKLKKEFPLRLHARTKPIGPLDEDDYIDINRLQNVPQRFGPGPVDLTSSFGSKLLKLTAKRSLINDAKAQLSIKKYKCLSSQSEEEVSTVVSKLRHQEKLPPIVFNHNTHYRWNDSLHKYYPYTRRHRMERYRILKTGLTRRSLRLKHLCNKTKVSIKVKRCEPPEYLKRIQLKLPKVCQTIEPRGPSFRMKRSRIKVPFFEDFLARKSTYENGDATVSQNISSDSNNFPSENNTTQPISLFENRALKPVNNDRPHKSRNTGKAVIITRENTVANPLAANFENQFDLK